MNKEEILRRSRQENKGQDEMEREVQAQAGRWAAGVGGILCAILILVDTIFTDSVNYATWAVYSSVFGTMQFVKYVKLRKKSDMICGGIELIAAVLFFVAYIMKIVR